MPSGQLFRTQHHGRSCSRKETLLGRKQTVTYMNRHLSTVTNFVTGNSEHDLTTM